MPSDSHAAGKVQPVDGRRRDDAPVDKLNCRISASLASAMHERCRSTGESVDHLVRVALADYLQVDHGTLFQVSTAGALVEGLYRGEVTVGALREHGDFGLGTFDGLDGEMVVVDGHFFQVCGDGTVREVSDDIRTPYAMITRFPTDAVSAAVPSRGTRTTAKLSRCANLAALHGQLDRLRDSQNVFYAIRIDGQFHSIVTRSVHRTPEGVPLVAAAGAQREFHLQNIRGTLVGFWSPGYLQTILVAGYHLHFLAHDRQSGGHLLECAGHGWHASLNRETDFRISLPESTAFLRADLTRDPAADLAHAETSQEKP